MTNPTLVIIAAGLGSRYGGLKQMAPIDETGHIIIDYSIYDAYRAGFRHVVCVVNPAREEEFRQHFSKINLPDLTITYAHQRLDNLPGGHPIPPGREKPWGTGYAVLSAKPYVSGAFSVINADDFYGANSFKLLYQFLTTQVSPTTQAMVGYKIESTLTENGSVSRGVCTVEGDILKAIREIQEITPTPTGAAYQEGNTQVNLPPGTIVSMNMWAFDHSFFDNMEARFIQFLEKAVTENPLKCEFHLPADAMAFVNAQNATVKILPTTEKWHGVTYANDMPSVRTAIAKMQAEGKYPANLFNA